MKRENCEFSSSAAIAAVVASVDANVSMFQDANSTYVLSCCVSVRLRTTSCLLPRPCSTPLLSSAFRWIVHPQRAGGRHRHSALRGAWVRQNSSARFQTLCSVGCGVTNAQLELSAAIQFGMLSPPQGHSQRRKQLPTFISLATFPCGTCWAGTTPVLTRHEEARYLQAHSVAAVMVYVGSYSRCGGTASLRFNSAGLFSPLLLEKCFFCTVRPHEGPGFPRTSQLGSV